MEKIIENVIHSCAFCGANYESKELAEQHVYECIYNFEDNQACFTCKHLVQVKEAPFKGKENGYESYKVLNAMGRFDYLVCGKKEIKLTDEDLNEIRMSCYEKFEDKEVITEKTEEFIAYEALINQAIDEELEHGEEVLKEGFNVGDKGQTT